MSTPIVYPIQSTGHPAPGTDSPLVHASRVPLSRMYVLDCPKCGKAIRIGLRRSPRKEGTADAWQKVNRCPYCAQTFNLSLVEAAPQ